MILQSQSADPSYDALIAYAKECLHDIPHASKMQVTYVFRDRFTHSIRVMKWCERLLLEIPADRESVMAAALLHDIGYTISAADHALHGAAMARGFLTNQGYAQELIDSVSNLIEHHSDKQLNPLKLSNELMILQDADCLDEIGALTVLWDCMAEGGADIQNYKKAYDRLSHSYDNITSKSRRMKTAFANQIYHERLLVLKNFLNELKYELFIT